MKTPPFSEMQDKLDQVRSTLATLLMETEITAERLAQAGFCPRFREATAQQMLKYIVQLDLRLASLRQQRQELLASESGLSAQHN